MKLILQAVKALIRKVYNSFPRKLSELENDLYSSEKVIPIACLDKDGIREIANVAAVEDGRVANFTEMGHVTAWNDYGRHSLHPPFGELVSAALSRKITVCHLNGLLGFALYFYKDELIKDSSDGTAAIRGYYFHNITCDSEGIKYHELVLQDDGKFTMTTKKLATV